MSFKELGAPIGTVLVADKQFIRKANHFRKQNGGGIRQSGLLATMAITAIDENFGKIQRSHDMAKELGKLCGENGIILEHPVETNFVFIDFPKNKMSSGVLTRLLKENGIKLYASRVAFHYQISQESFEKCKKVVLECYKDSLQNPYTGRSFTYYQAK